MDFLKNIIRFFSLPALLFVVLFIAPFQWIRSGKDVDATILKLLSRIEIGGPLKWNGGNVEVVAIDKMDRYHYLQLSNSHVVIIGKRRVRLVRKVNGDDWAWIPKNDWTISIQSGNLAIIDHKNHHKQ